MTAFHMVAAEISVRIVFALPWCHSHLSTLGGRITIYMIFSNQECRLWMCYEFIHLSCFFRVELRCWSLGHGKRPPQITAVCLTRSQFQLLLSSQGCCVVTAQVRQEKAYIYTYNIYNISLVKGQYHHMIHEPKTNKTNGLCFFFNFLANLWIKYHFFILLRFILQFCSELNNAKWATVYLCCFLFHFDIYCMTTVAL